MKKSDAFRNFLQNIAYKRQAQMEVFDVLKNKNEISPLTYEFISTVVDNKRLDALPKIIDKYLEYYRILSKEENITIISA